MIKINNVKLTGVGSSVSRSHVEIYIWFDGDNSVNVEVPPTEEGLKALESLIIQAQMGHMSISRELNKPQKFEV